MPSPEAAFSDSDQGHKQQMEHETDSTPSPEALSDLDQGHKQQVEHKKRKGQFEDDSGQMDESQLYLQKRFRWPATERRSDRAPTTKKRRTISHEESLERRLGDKSRQYNELLARHRLCTHETMTKKVSSRTSGIVENSVLSNSYSYPQAQLEYIDVVPLTHDDMNVASLETLVSNEETTSYILREYSLTKHVKEYHGHNTSVHEYKVLVDNEGIKFIPRPLGIYDDFRSHYSGNAMFVYTLESDEDNYRSVAQEMSSSGSTGYGKRYFLQIALTCATALRDLHSNGYIHNQVFPDNIMIVERNSVEVGVLDNFSKACAVETAKPLTSAQVDEVQWASQYIAPEVLSRRCCPTRSSDVYSFGKSLMSIAVRKKFVTVVNYVVYKCISDTPSDRFSMRDICLELRKVAEREGISVPRVLSGTKI